MALWAFNADSLPRMLDWARQRALEDDQFVALARAYRTFIRGGNAGCSGDYRDRPDVSASTAVNDTELRATDPRHRAEHSVVVASQRGTRNRFRASRTGPNGVGQLIDTRHDPVDRRTHSLG